MTPLPENPIVKIVVNEENGNLMAVANNISPELTVELIPANKCTFDTDVAGLPFVANEQHFCHNCSCCDSK